LTQGTFALPDDALPPLAYVAPEAPSAAPAAGWDMSGYRLQTLSPTASEAEAAAAAEADELGPDEPIVRPASSCDSPHSLYRALAVPDRSVLPGQLWVCQVRQRMSTELGWDELLSSRPPLSAATLSCRCVGMQLTRPFSAAGWGHVDFVPGWAAPRRAAHRPDRLSRDSHRCTLLARYSSSAMCHVHAVTEWECLTGSV